MNLRLFIAPGLALFLSSASFAQEAEVTAPVTVPTAPMGVVAPAAVAPTAPPAAPTDMVAPSAAAPPPAAPMGEVVPSGTVPPTTIPGATVPAATVPTAPMGVVAPTGTLPVAPTSPVAAPAAAVPTTPKGVTAPPAMVPITPKAAELPVLPDAPLPELPPLSGVEDKVFSYGRADYTLMFTPKQIATMKQVLASYEMLRMNGIQEDLAVVEEPILVPVAIAEPTSYPNFYLSSIVYRSPSEWTVWLDGKRITPKTNEGELKVTSVQKNRVSFVWKPTYIKTLLDRYDAKLFAPTDAVRHFLVKPQTVAVDRKTEEISFSLQMNQSFSAPYFASFEGRVASPPPLPVQDLALPVSTPSMGESVASTINSLLGDALKKDSSEEERKMDRVFPTENTLKINP